MCHELILRMSGMIFFELYLKRKNVRICHDPCHHWWGKSQDLKYSIGMISSKVKDVKHRAFLWSSIRVSLNHTVICVIIGSGRIDKHWFHGWRSSCHDSCHVFIKNIWSFSCVSLKIMFKWSNFYILMCLMFLWEHKNDHVHLRNSSTTYRKFLDHINFYDDDNLRFMLWASFILTTHWLSWTCLFGILRNWCNSNFMTT